MRSETKNEKNNFVMVIWHKKGTEKDQEEQRHTLKKYFIKKLHKVL